MLSLANKISIITGASSGIGKATAILFSQLGSKLVLVGRDESALDQTIEMCDPQRKNDIIKVSGDLCNAETCKKIVEQAVQKFGTISILVIFTKKKNK